MWYRLKSIFLHLYLTWDIVLCEVWWLLLLTVRTPRGTLSILPHKLVILSPNLHQTVAEAKESKDNSYRVQPESVVNLNPDEFHNSISLPEFIEKYQHLRNGRKANVDVSLSGLYGLIWYESNVPSDCYSGLLPPTPGDWEEGECGSQFVR